MRFPTAFLAACFCASLAYADVPPPPKAESTVVVLAGEGIGSGFHIGNDIFVTAAHVVDRETTVILELSDNRRAAADVLFTDRRTDLAFLRAEPHIRGIDTAKVICRVAVIGERITAIGHPGGERFIHTWGSVAGVPRELGPWPIVVPLDMLVSPGNSGGPMLDERGNVVGVIVGLRRIAAPMFGFYQSVSLAVPSLSVCKARDYLGIR